jgi:hypothetical protein
LIAPGKSLIIKTSQHGNLSYRLASLGRFEPRSARPRPGRLIRMEEMSTKTGVAKKRDDVRDHYWPDADPWTGEGEVGWFKETQTLPLLLVLLNEKVISGNNDPRSTYVELLARQMGEGVIEMGHEKDHEPR